MEIPKTKPHQDNATNKLSKNLEFNFFNQNYFRSYREVGTVKAPNWYEQFCLSLNIIAVFVATKIKQNSWPKFLA